MKPEVDQTLQALAARLMLEIAPQVSVPYGKSTVEIVGILLIEAAEEYDRAAEIRVEENRAIRKIFADSAPDVPDRDLRERLAAAANENEASLRISALNQSNDALRRLLIELHERVETLDTPWARRVNDAIWKELRASAARRALSFFPG